MSTTRKKDDDEIQRGMEMGGEGSTGACMAIFGGEEDCLGKE